MTGVRYETADRYESYLISGQIREKTFDTEDELRKFSRNIRQYVAKYYPQAELHVHRNVKGIGITIYFLRNQ